MTWLRLLSRTRTDELEFPLPRPRHRYLALRRWLALGGLLLLVAPFLGCGTGGNAKVAREIRRDIRRHDMPEDAPWRDRRTRALVRAFYQARHWQPAWTNGAGATGEAHELAQMVARAEEEGLDPEDYSAAELQEHWKENRGRLLGERDPKALAEFDLLCTIAAFHYMSDVLDGRISPKALDAEWVAKPRRGDIDSLLSDALRRHRVKEALRELPPPHEQYRRLREARGRYARLAAAGQDTAAYRLRQIELNMERWRWVPRSLGDRYLVVNIPEYTLQAIEHGRPVLEMKVVVGKSLTATPVFSDRMTAVVVNPTWNVPASIARNELAALIENDRGYLARNRIRVFDRENEKGGEVDAAWVDWSDADEVERLHLRQDAGEANALGRIKFLLPNRFDVYLHDTPAGHLFSREERSFSHGCVRVEDPLKLARYVLRGTREAAPGVVERLIAGEATRTLALEHPLPVHLLYFTAIAEGNGAVGFRDDVYGIDQELIRKLRSRSRARARA